MGKSEQCECNQRERINLVFVQVINVTHIHKVRFGLNGKHHTLIVGSIPTTPTIGAVLCNGKTADRPVKVIDYEFESRLHHNKFNNFNNKTKQHERKTKK